MYHNERENEILKYLAGEGYATVKQLSELLHTSESSVRRDLTALEKQGIVSRSYGGAELVRNSSQILPFSARAHQNISAKKVMAQKASRLIHEGDIVFLDQSSSAFFVAYELLKKADITVVTNNIEIISLLSQAEMEVISSGGKLSRSNRNCLLGTDAQQIFAQIHADVLFFSAKALSTDGTIYDCDREEVCIRNAMLANAEKRIFLCSSDKIGSYSGYRQCSLKDTDHLITELNSLEQTKGLEAFRDIHL